MWGGPFVWKIKPTSNYVSVASEEEVTVASLSVEKPSFSLTQSCAFNWLQRKISFLRSP